MRATNWGCCCACRARRICCWRPSVRTAPTRLLASLGLATCCSATPRCSLSLARSRAHSPSLALSLARSLAHSLSLSLARSLAPHTHPSTHARTHARTHTHTHTHKQTHAFTCIHTRTPPDGEPSQRPPQMPFHHHWHSAAMPVDAADATGGRCGADCQRAARGDHLPAPAR